MKKSSNEQQPAENVKCYIQVIFPGWKPLYWILQCKQSRRFIFHAEIPTIYF